MIDKLYHYVNSALLSKTVHQLYKCGVDVARATHSLYQNDDECFVAVSRRTRKDGGL